MNLKTIADAIAARYASVTATNGAATETATATADLPNQIGSLALLVYPPTGDLDLIMGPRLFDRWIFPVRLLRDPLSVPQRSQWLYAWATALRLRVETNFDLDVAGVQGAQTRVARLALDGERYASADGTYAEFDVVELLIWVRVLENAPSVAV